MMILCHRSITPFPYTTLFRSSLHDTVKCQHRAEHGVAEDQQVLMAGVLLEQDLVYPQRLAPAVMKGLGPVPLRHQRVPAGVGWLSFWVSPRNCSPTVALLGLKARFRIGMAFSGCASPHMKMSNAA